MLITFLTVISWMYVCIYVLSTGVSLYFYYTLTKYEKEIAIVSFPVASTVVFLLSIAFLITKALT